MGEGVRLTGVRDALGVMEDDAVVDAVMDGLGVLDGVMDGVAVWLPVTDAVGVREGVRDEEGVLEGDTLAVGVVEGVPLALRVCVGVWDRVGVCVRWALRVRDWEGECEPDGVSDAVRDPLPLPLADLEEEGDCDDDLEEEGVCEDDALPLPDPLAVLLADAPLECVLVPVWECDSEREDDAVEEEDGELDAEEVALFVPEGEPEDDLLPDRDPVAEGEPVDDVLPEEDPLPLAVALELLLADVVEEGVLLSVMVGVGAELIDTETEASSKEACASQESDSSSGAMVKWR